MRYSAGCPRFSPRERSGRNDREDHLKGRSFLRSTPTAVPSPRHANAVPHRVFKLSLLRLNSTATGSSEPTM